MKKPIRMILDRVCAVSGALICVQLPIFIQQYTSHLSGRIAELDLQVEAMRRAAALSSKTLTQYVHKFQASGDIDFVQQGEIIKKMIERLSSLRETFQALSHASVWSKPFIFVSHFHWDITKSTFSHFQMAIPFTSEGLFYGLLGIGLGYVVFSLGAFLCSTFWNYFSS